MFRENGKNSEISIKKKIIVKLQNLKKNKSNENLKVDKNNIYKNYYNFIDKREININCKFKKCINPFYQKNKSTKNEKCQKLAHKKNNYFFKVKSNYKIYSPTNNNSKLLKLENVKPDEKNGDLSNNINKKNK